MTGGASRAATELCLVLLDNFFGPTVAVSYSAIAFHDGRQND